LGVGRSTLAPARVPAGHDGAQRLWSAGGLMPLFRPRLDSAARRPAWCCAPAKTGPSSRLDPKAASSRRHSKDAARHHGPDRLSRGRAGRDRPMMTRQRLWSVGGLTPLSDRAGLTARSSQGRSTTPVGGQPSRASAGKAASSRRHSKDAARHHGPRGREPGPTSNVEHRTSNTERRTPNAQRRTPNARVQKVIRHSSLVTCQKKWLVRAGAGGRLTA